MGIVAKRSSMIFFSDPCSQYSHRVRIVLAEKGVAVDIKDVKNNNLPEDLLEVNPYGGLPTLIDRELVLYESNIIMEYLDERFPHPPLLPVYPVARAESRLFMHRIQQDWSSCVDEIVAAKNKESVTSARKQLRESLSSASLIFAERPYFMSEEFSLVDCCVAPILWRLDMLGIDLPEKPAKLINKYLARLTSRSTFQASLSEDEKEMRL